MRIGGRKRRPRCFPWVIRVLIGGMALSFLLAIAATSSPALGTQAGVAAVVPPAAGLTPLNPGWKTDQMNVQVWPEYDEKAVLVIMNLSLPAEVQLPATFEFAIPKGALIAGVGEIGPNGSFKYNYADSYPPVQPGAEWDIVTIQVREFRSLQIDYYYDPGLPAGAGERSFPVLLQVPMDVGTLLEHVQEPARATDFRVEPAPQSSGEAEDGFTYAVSTFSDVKAGSTLGQLVSYSKPDGNTSTATNQSAPAQIRTSTVLLAALLFIVVVGGGLIVYFVYRKSAKTKESAGRPRTQRSPAAPPKRSPAARSQGATPLKRAARAGNGATDAGEAVTGLCDACGEELTKKVRFCPNCGEAQDG